MSYSSTLYPHVRLWWKSCAPQRHSCRQRPLNSRAYRHHLTHMTRWEDSPPIKAAWLSLCSAEATNQLQLSQLLSQHHLTLKQSHIWHSCPPTNGSRVCSEKPLLALPMSEEAAFKWIVWFEDSCCDQQRLWNGRSSPTSTRPIRNMSARIKERETTANVWQRDPNHPLLVWRLQIVVAIRDQIRL